MATTTSINDKILDRNEEQRCCVGSLVLSSLLVTAEHKTLWESISLKLYRSLSHWELWSDNSLGQLHKVWLRDSGVGLPLARTVPSRSKHWILSVRGPKFPSSLFMSSKSYRNVLQQQFQAISTSALFNPVVVEVKQWCHYTERRYTPPPCHSVVSEKHLCCVHHKSCQEANLKLQVNWWLECLAEKWGANSPWLMSNNIICYRLQEEVVSITSLSLFGKCFGIRMLERRYMWTRSSDIFWMLFHMHFIHFL